MPQKKILGSTHRIRRRIYRYDSETLEVVGSGLHEINALLLFNKLRILLGAKKAGHNNVKEETEKVLNRLNEIGLYTIERNKKIINKYFK